MKHREPRQAVYLAARVRTERGWIDASIHNVSSHGMLLQSAHPPRPGSYVELRRAANTIIARIVWANGCFFGVRTQELIELGQLCGERCAAALDRLGGWNGRERRSPERLSHDAQFAANRDAARLTEFAVISTGIVGGLLWAATTLWPLISHGSIVVRTAMGGS